MLGREEASLHSVRRSIRLLGNGRGGLSDIAIRIGEFNELAVLDAMRDHGGALERLQTSPEIHYGGLLADLGVLHAIQFVRLHETSAARRISLKEDGAYIATMNEAGDLLSPHYVLAEEARDWAGAAAVLEHAIASSRTQGLRGATARERFLRPRLAHAYAMGGRAAEARPLLSGNPRDCHRCLVLEAGALAALGDIARSERVFAEAAQQAPSLPTAHAEWGRARLERGDAAGALPLLREAQRRGPRWADPLKFEGDALARQGKHRAAVGRYAAAAERAPRWGALHLAWGRSLAALGHREQARLKYAQAARLDLAAADRTAVQRLLGNGLDGSVRAN